jgi:hypothetical protein
MIPSSLAVKSFYIAGVNWTFQVQDAESLVGCNVEGFIFLPGKTLKRTTSSSPQVSCCEVANLARRKQVKQEL